MSAAHFIAEDLTGDLIVLTGEEAAHASRSLRLRPGEPVTVTDGRGTMIAGRVHGHPSGGEVTVEVLERRFVEPATPQIGICPAVPKGGKLDLIVQKLTELGVARISPWFAERSVVRWGDAKRVAQGERLRAVARSALKQSRRAWLPVVDDPGPLDELAGEVIVLHEGEASRLHEILPGLSGVTVSVVVGPEGGLSDAEIARFVARDATLAGLGEGVLRAETAAIVGAALVMGHFHLVG